LINILHIRHLGETRIEKQLIELYAAPVILSRKEALNEPENTRFRLKFRRGPVRLEYSHVMRVLLALPLLIASFLSVQSAAQAVPTSVPDYSGMYEFLRDGEFVQLTIEDKGIVTGFISRFGDSESDKGVFMNQFFKSGTLEGEKLGFVTEPVHGTWF